MKTVVIYFILSLFSQGIVFAQNNSIQNAAEGNNSFCYDWLKINYLEGENQVFSPQSISIAMSMLYDGSACTTKREIQQVMYFHRNRAKNHKSWINYIQLFKHFKNPLFHSANAVWTDKNESYQDKFIRNIEDYDAIIKPVDFSKTEEREDARRRMNHWVADQTQNKIKELIKQGDIEDLTRLVLINALYFNANWKIEFPKNNTSAGKFSAGDNSYRIDFMQNIAEFSYLKTDQCQLVSIPFENDQTSMIIILPNDDITNEQIIKNLNNKFLSELLNQTSKEKISLKIPKFSLDIRLEMKENLKKLGILEAFSGDANFKHINGKNNLMLDEVIHQAVIELDEKGVEASAATAVVVREKSAHKIPEFNANRPFIFIIKENKYNSILFAGVYEKPVK
jgi:serpin B